MERRGGVVGEKCTMGDGTQRMWGWMRVMALHYASWITGRGGSFHGLVSRVPLLLHTHAVAMAAELPLTLTDSGHKIIGLPPTGKLLIGKLYSSPKMVLDTCNHLQDVLLIVIQPIWIYKAFASPLALWHISRPDFMLEDSKISALQIVKGIQIQLFCIAFCIGHSCCEALWSTYVYCTFQQPKCWTWRWVFYVRLNYSCKTFTTKSKLEQELEDKRTKMRDHCQQLWPTIAQE